MELGEVQCLVGRVAAVDDSWADRVALEVAAGEVRRLKSWVEGREVAIARLLAKVSSFPEKALADSGRTDLRQAGRVLRRGEIAERIPGLDESLNSGRVSADHVDVLDRALRKLEPDLQAKLVDDAKRLLAIAEHSTPDEFARTVSEDVRRLQRDHDGLERLERQRREIRLHTWLDRVTGMGRWSATWDPETMVKLENRLDTQVQAMFHDHLPEGCPTDLLEKQAYLRALAFLALFNGEGTGVGRPEIIVVEDHTHPHADGSPTVDWGIPVDLPQRVLDDLYETADVYRVTVRNGVIIDAPGELNLGRSTRLANRAQRRALRAIYSTCAIPGCQVRYSRTKLHHVHWWRHGGLTDLENLLPVCVVHHGNIHHDGWIVTLTPDRTLTITLPDGTTMTTGPPPRQAA